MMRAALLLLALAGVHVDAWTAPAAASRTVSLRAAAASQRMHVQMKDEGFTFDDPETTETMQVVEEVELTEKQKEIARLRAAEKFMKKDTGDAVCRTCGYQFKMEVGERLIPRNTPFQLVPDSYTCPNCKSPKAFFDPVQIEIAGFADNQQYGFGTNTWTEGQKSTVIFGGLGLFVLLFLGGYALN